MRWMLTSTMPSFEEALRSAGEDVVSTPADHVEAYLTPQSTSIRDYPLRDVVQRLSPNVIVLVNPLRLFPLANDRFLELGYSRSVTAGLRRGRSDYVLVFGAFDDPSIFNAFKTGRAPGCVCRPQDADVYLTSSEDVYRALVPTRRTVHWKNDGVGPLQRAVQHAQQRQRYQYRATRQDPFL